MPIYLLWEFETPKEEERNNKRYKLSDEVNTPYIERKHKEGVKWKILDMADGTGRMVELHTFETMEDFEKIWGDEEFHKMVIQYCRVVDNASVRILRPGIRVRP